MADVDFVAVQAVAHAVVAVPIVVAAAVAIVEPVAAEPIVAEQLDSADIADKEERLLADAEHIAGIAADSGPVVDIEVDRRNKAVAVDTDIRHKEDTSLELEFH